MGACSREVPELSPPTRSWKRRAQMVGCRDVRGAADRLSWCAMGDDELGNFAPGLALLSSRHETQYSRLFRS